MSLFNFDLFKLMLKRRSKLCESSICHIELRWRFDFRRVYLSSRLLPPFPLPTLSSSSSSSPPPFRNSIWLLLLEECVIFPALLICARMAFNLMWIFGNLQEYRFCQIFSKSFPPDSSMSEQSILYDYDKCVNADND